MNYGMITVRLYGKPVNTWTHWEEVTVRNPWTGELEKRELERQFQWELPYREYDTDGELVATGTEDFQRTRYRDLIDGYVYVWNGKLNRGGHKVWHSEKRVVYTRGQGKRVKEIARNWYPDALEIKVGR